MSDLIVGRYILIKGIVQGVGFRPFVFSQAKGFNLSGWVCNSAQGVEIEINGPEDKIDAFINSIKNNPPPLSTIDYIDIQEISTNGYTNFSIKDSMDRNSKFIPISPDVSICNECKNELFDSNNRRYRYPFINCTNCGPRFSIIKKIPYDRPFTTMASFEMCEDCNTEYVDPFDRRFHAQPIACPECGPNVWFETGDHTSLLEESAIVEARNYLRDGKIIAIKGLGGFHLACDASNKNSVKILRERKGRMFKPFALMAYNTEIIQKYCELNNAETNLIESPQHPIVLLKKRLNSQLCDSISPNQTHLGFMLPYTPLHLLLLEPEKNNSFPKVLVMTSGNISEEPIYFTNDTARRDLSHIADGFLMHNRDIHTRIDDSVVRIFNNKPYPVRRARGYAPTPIITSEKLPQIFSGGAEFKNTFSLSRDNYIFISHHIGDLDNYPTYQAYKKAIHHYENIFRINPECIICDLHPDYLSTKYSNQKACKNDIPIFYVQHHHAHFASCLLDNNYTSNKPALCFCFDGTGLGTDGNIWGGEVLLGSYKNFERVYHLDYKKMPGGDLAAKKPYRMALSYLISAGLNYSDDLPIFRNTNTKELETIQKQIKRNINTPLTSSVGRLFDTVSSIIGVCQNNYYEGQAAIELEAIHDPEEDDFYNIEIENDIIMTDDLLELILNDLHNNVSRSKISSRFHNGLAHMVNNIALKFKKTRNIDTVALSGGVWQNMTLLKKTYKLLEDNEFNVLTHHNIPPNDGGISTGQTIIGANLFQ